MAFFKSMWKANSKHEKLSEELVIKNSKKSKEEEEKSKETITNESDSVAFKLKYLGNVVVDKISGENVSSEAVKNIIKTTKEVKKKTCPIITLYISLKGITVTDSQGEDILKVSIYRISNCSTDASHRQIFSFISSDTNQVSTCHAFLCSKRKIAQNVTLAVASAFSTAYQNWNQLSLTTEDIKNLIQSKENEKNNLNQFPINETTNDERLIDLDSEPLTKIDLFNLDNRPHPKSTKHEWVSFDDEYFADPFSNKFQ